METTQIISQQDIRMINYYVSLESKGSVMLTCYLRFRLKSLLWRRVSRTLEKLKMREWAMLLQNRPGVNDLKLSGCVA